MKKLSKVSKLEIICKFHVSKKLFIKRANLK